MNIAEIQTRIGINKEGNSNSPTDKAIDRIMDKIAKSKYGFNTSLKQFDAMPTREKRKVKCIKLDYNELGSIHRLMPKRKTRRKNGKRK